LNQKQAQPKNPWAGKQFNPYAPVQYPDMPASGSADGLDYSWLMS